MFTHRSGARINIRQSYIRGGYVKGSDGYASGSGGVGDGGGDGGFGGHGTALRQMLTCSLDATGEYFCVLISLLRFFMLTCSLEPPVSVSVYFISF
jgi:hypothetical protein